ncbi:MAG TPA: hypothetical protein V6C65_27025 [Allocoleopsis sp.]
MTPFLDPSESSSGELAHSNEHALTEQPLIEKDPLFQAQVQRLHQLAVFSRWAVIGLLWVLIAPFCLWAIRDELTLWHDYFTWTAVRYTIIYNRLPALGLLLCLGITVGVLVWQSHNILWGFSQDYVRSLEKQVLRIRRQGRSHPLWKWVCEP